MARNYQKASLSYSLCKLQNKMFALEQDNSTEPKFKTINVLFSLFNMCKTYNFVFVDVVTGG
jgi:hypothetical protein